MTIRTSNRAHGFSLVELLLTLVLILCLAAAAVFSFTAIYRSANLDEGLDRMQALIRFAQAEAATTGRKVRIQFEPAPAAVSTSSQPELRRIRVTWEADYLTAPGVFQTYTNKAWSEEMVNELVGVEKVKPLESTRATTVEPAIDSEFEEFFVDEFPSITFYPDGSCDSAEIVLASLNEEDQRRLAVRITGILGTVSSRSVSSADGADELSDELADQAAAEEFDELFESATPVDSFNSWQSE